MSTTLSPIPPVHLKNRFYRVTFVDRKYVVTIMAFRGDDAVIEAIKTLQDRDLIPRLNAYDQRYRLGYIHTLRLKEPEPQYWVRPL